jgi:radical SAM superfamily enzyme YgiQ (UPF0313 family)
MASDVVLINSNEIQPPIAPIGLDYLAGTLRRSGHGVRLIDLNLAADADETLAAGLNDGEPRLVGISFRNSDDCFYPSGHSFVPRLQQVIEVVRRQTGAPIVLGGAGFSVFPEAILEATGCEFGIAGDGERALVGLVDALENGHELADVPGLVWRPDDGQSYRVNPPLPANPLSLPTGRDAVDNPRYFGEGGQIGLETKRGCDRHCVYCADPLIKGNTVRIRAPREVAEEAENLLAQGIDVLHLCDSEFNLEYDHALAICREFSRRGLGEHLQWYTYAAVVPFDTELAAAMRRAGCVGINFGADSANADMLCSYGRRHRKEDIASAVTLCKQNGIRAMIDLLLGGAGETPDTVRETIKFMKAADPYAVGAALGVRLYPGTALARRLSDEGTLAEDPGVRTVSSRQGPDGLLRPVFYVSPELGPQPAQLVRDVIGDDERFFEPAPLEQLEDYNYSDNEALCEAIRGGARGAYWDILRQARGA